MFISVLRKYIGTIISVFGFALLCILTFGDIYEIMTEEYWRNVWHNITAIGLMSISLTTIQTTIKQGLAEQALQRGLNTEAAKNKYAEHKAIITQNISRMIYVPYFLQVYNKRHTKLRQREFLLMNNYKSEELLFLSKRKKLIKKYKKIKVDLNVASIKWATTDIVYNKYGRIETLAAYRKKRLLRGIVFSTVCMFATTLVTRGLFFSIVDEPLSHKFVRLATYTFTIILTSVLRVIKEYEKGAFGIPNELDEINEVWHEFESWEAPEWVEKDISESMKEVMTNDKRGDLQEEQTTCKECPDPEADFENHTDLSGPYIFTCGIEELDRQPVGDCREAGQEEVYGSSVGGQLSIFDNQVG